MDPWPHSPHAQPEEGSGTSTPVGAGEDLDFSDLKKKKKKSSKKVAFDMEAFEKELSESKVKEAEDEDGEEGGALEEYDEADLGDDPFARAGEAVTLESGTEPWLGSDRDYTYAEVRLLSRSLRLYSADTTHASPSAPPPLLRPATRVESSASRIIRQALHDCAAAGVAGG